jgi:hypothetical protein
MPFRKIAKKFDMKQIAADLKATLIYSDSISSCVIDRIAEITGYSKRSVYAVLAGEIELTLDFLHACVVATDGDPEVRKYLEPDGFQLVRTFLAVSDKKTLAEECLDDVPMLAAYHAKLNDPKATKADVRRALDAVILELHENEARRNATIENGGG